MKTLHGSLGGYLAISLLTFGCASSDSDADVGGQAEAVTGPATLHVSLTIAESKVVFSSHVEAFAVNDGQNLNLPCRDQSFSMTSKPSLYSGWSPASVDTFSAEVAGAKFREHPFASCRNPDTQVLGWFGKERDIEFIPSEQLLDKDYDAVKLPLLLQMKVLGSSSATYYSCNGAFKKTLIGESDNAKRFNISVACKSVAAPSHGQLGPIDFITSPGPYAAVATYRGWMLPAVASSQANFDRVRDALLANVPAERYSGAMRTLSSLCDLTVETKGDALVVDHTIKSSGHTRHLELKAEDLLGFAEGDLFSDPLRVRGEPTGTFAAAEFRDSKGDSFVLRFEQNTTLDARVMRINGSETSCRRLEKR
jgi:hypothetical protein